LPRPCLTGWVTLVGLLLLLLCIGYLLPYFSPFLFALFLAALLDAPVNYLERFGMARHYAVLIILGLLLILMVGVTSLVAVHLLRDLTRLATQLPTLANRISQYANVLVTRLQTISLGFPLPLADSIESLAQRMIMAMEALLHTSMASLLALPTLLTNLMVCILATFFMVRDGRLLARQALAMLPQSWHKKSARIKRDLFAGLVGFVRAEVILMFITSMLTTIGLMLFKAPYAWLFGVVAGIFDLLPLVGVGGVFLPLTLSFWLIGKTTQAAGLLAAWGVVVLVRQACEPVLMKAKIGMHPLTSLVTIYVGLRIWGFSGAFLTPIAAISFKVLWLGALKPFLLGK
jgi:sporulation integral membrane protein YtvI